MILTIKALHDIYYQYEQIQDTYCGHETDWKLAYSNLHGLYKLLLYGKTRGDSNYSFVEFIRIHMVNLINQECVRVNDIIRSNEKEKKEWIPINELPDFEKDIWVTVKLPDGKYDVISSRYCIQFGDPLWIDSFPSIWEMKYDGKYEKICWKYRDNKPKPCIE